MSLLQSNHSVLDSWKSKEKYYKISAKNPCPECTYDYDDADFDGHVDEEVEDKTVQWVRRSYDNGDDDDETVLQCSRESNLKMMMVMMMMVIMVILW